MSPSPSAPEAAYPSVDASAPGAPREACALLAMVRGLCARHGISSLAPGLAAAAELLSPGSLVDVAILGQFKAGKSSLINSILDDPLLPVGVLPLTSVITRLQYGEVLTVRVRYADGRSAAVDAAAIADLVTEERNPANAKGVDIVDIETPRMKEIAGLRLVDTPGVGSAYAHNTAATTEWLPHAGAVLLAMSAERPMAAGDVDMIREARKQCPEVVLVVTKADLLTPQQLAEVERFVRDTARKDLQRPPRVFAYSIRDTTETHRRRIIDEVLKPLAGSCRQVRREALLHKLANVATQLVGLLRIALATARRADAERLDLRCRIMDEQTSISLVRTELDLISRRYQGQTRDAIYAMLDEFTPAVVRRLQRELPARMNDWEGGYQGLAERYREWMGAALQRELGAAIEACLPRLADFLQNAQKHFSRYEQGFYSRLDRTIEQALGTRPVRAGPHASPFDSLVPDVTVGRALDIDFGFLWYLVPRFLAAALLRHRLREQVPWEVQKNTIRLTSMLAEQMNARIEGMKARFASRIEGELSTIESLLTKHSEEAPAIQRDIEGLELALASVGRGGQGSG